MILDITNSADPPGTIHIDFYDNLKKQLIENLVKYSKTDFQTKHEIPLHQLAATYCYSQKQRETETRKWQKGKDGSEIRLAKRRGYTHYISSILSR